MAYLTLPASKIATHSLSVSFQIWGKFSLTWQGFLLGGGEKIPDSAPWTSALKLTVCPEYTVWLCLPLTVAASDKNK